MFITGPAGCGKSTCIELAKKCCHKSCHLAGLPFDNTAFYFTSTTGLSACLFGGTTIHNTVDLTKDWVTDALCLNWTFVKIIIIDEVLFFKDIDVEELDKKLRRLTKQNTLHGCIILIFSWWLSPTSTCHDNRNFVHWISQKHHVEECHKLPDFLEKSSI